MTRPGSKGKPKRVLVVEDDPPIQELFSQIVKKEGFRVELAKDGAEALEKISVSEPDLILLDLMLPHVHGSEVLSKLRSEKRTHIPIIVVTAYYDASTKPLLQKHPNVVKFFKKPIRGKELAEVIHQLLDR